MPSRRKIVNVTLLFGLACVALEGAASARQLPIVRTASTCDRGIDISGDGVMDHVFEADICSLFAPPVGVLASEERTAVEFRAAQRIGGSLIGQTIESAMLVLTPQSGPDGNLGLAPGEVVRIYGYRSNDTVITVGDLEPAGKYLAAVLEGPTDDGPVSIPLHPRTVTGLLKSKTFAIGFLLMAQKGASPVSLAFGSTYSGVPVSQRPTLQLVVLP
jgi:hypothetical protein